VAEATTTTATVATTTTTTTTTTATAKGGGGGEEREGGQEPPLGNAVETCALQPQNSENLKKLKLEILKNVNMDNSKVEIWRFNYKPFTCTSLECFTFSIYRISRDDKFPTFPQIYRSKVLEISGLNC
jgi:hypothetical protein